jgi:hypothetical protein
MEDEKELVAERAKLEKRYKKPQLSSVDHPRRKNLLIILKLSR